MEKAHARALGLAEFEGAAARATSDVGLSQRWVVDHCENPSRGAGAKELSNHRAAV
jgi:hypothetical protein